MSRIRLLSGRRIWCLWSLWCRRMQLVLLDLSGVVARGRLLMRRGWILVHRNRLLTRRHWLLIRSDNFLGRRSRLLTRDSRLLLWRHVLMSWSLHVLLTRRKFRYRAGECRSRWSTLCSRSGERLPAGVWWHRRQRRTIYRCRNLALSRVRCSPAVKVMITSTPSPAVATAGVMCWLGEWRTRCTTAQGVSDVPSST